MREVQTAQGRGRTTPPPSPKGFREVDQPAPDASVSG
jgi:hypothetical protein